MDKTPATNTPLETLRDGRLKATIWENTGESGTYHTVSLAKIFEDRDGKLQETSSFSAGELLRVAELARESHAYVRDLNRHQAREAKAERSDSPRTSGTAASTPRRFQGRGDTTQDR